MNELNIINFLFAKSYDSFEIIDENFSNVIINKNEKIIVPNDLILLTINSVAPYYYVINECVDLFVHNYNIVLNENILSNPDMFGTLLISNENNDLFKEWYSFKDYMLNENQISIDFDDRINILAQYLSLYNINEDIFIDQIKAYPLNYSTNIGTINELYSLCEIYFHAGYDERLLDSPYNSDESIRKGLEQWGKERYGHKANIEVLMNSATPAHNYGNYQVIARTSDGKLIEKQMFALDRRRMNRENNKIKRLRKVEKSVNNSPIFQKKIEEKDKNNSNSQTFLQKYEKFMDKGFNKLENWIANPNAKGKKTLRKIGPKSKELIKKMNDKIKNVDWKAQNERIRNKLGAGKEKAKEFIKDKSNKISIWNNNRKKLGYNRITGKPASWLK